MRERSEAPLTYRGPNGLVTAAEAHDELLGWLARHTFADIDAAAEALRGTAVYHHEHDRAWIDWEWNPDVDASWRVYPARRAAGRALHCSHAATLEQAVAIIRDEIERSVSLLGQPRRFEATPQ